MTDIDITAADMLAELDDELEHVGIEICFAELKGPVKDRFKQYDLFTRLGDHVFFRTTAQAVEGYFEKHPGEKTD